MAKKDSKTQLLDAAIYEFAKNGYNGAKTRDIAAKAKMNISAILYYFGGKEGLYKGAMEALVDTVNTLMADLLKEYDEVLKNNRESEAAQELLHKFIAMFIHLLCGKTLSKNMLTIFMTEYAHPSENFDILYNGLVAPLHRMMATLLSKASNGKIDMKQANFYFFPIFSQMFVFSSRKEAICKFMEWKEYTPKEIDQILDYAVYQVNSILNRYK